jgi:transcriptional regulator with XRE-family HTH domain
MFRDMGIVNDIRQALKSDPRPKKDIAALVDLDPISLSLFQNGHRSVSSAVLDKLCGVLGVTVKVPAGKRQPKSKG